MAMPDWVLPFREPRTEIKLIKGTYYKYAVSYRYSSEKKRTVKISGHLLGKITREDGFVPSDKDTIRKRSEQPKVDIKTFGVYNLFDNLLSPEIASLKEAFGAAEAEKLLSFSMTRWAYQSPIKRAPHYHAHDYCSQRWSKGGLTAKQVSQSLKYFGQNREAVVEWMRGVLDRAPETENSFVMMDSTHTPSASENLAVNAKGYNPSFDFGKQFRLMYMFSSQLKLPVYYRLINGNIPDVTSMSLCVKEFKAKNVIFVADKGFYSEDNVKTLDSQHLQYIIPLRRNNKLVDLAPLRDPDFKKNVKNYFSYQNRAIWYWQYEKDGRQLVTFLDDYLRVSEENDYLQRIITKPEEYTKAGFVEKLHSFGTLTIVHKTNKALNPNEIYETYKLRNEIEILFDSYKNFLDADVTYMQDKYVLNGWLFANFIAMTAYCKLFARLKQAGLLSKYSPKDIVEMSKAIFSLKNGNQWLQSETTARVRAIFKKIGIDYLT